MCCIMLVTLSTSEPETPDNTIRWPNADVIPGHRLRRCANIILTETLSALNLKYNGEYIFFWTIVKDNST